MIVRDERSDAGRPDRLRRGWSCVPALVLALVVGSSGTMIPLAVPMGAAGLGPLGTPLETPPVAVETPPPDACCDGASTVRRDPLPAATAQGVPAVHPRARVVAARRPLLPRLTTRPSERPAGSCLLPRPPPPTTVV